MNSPNRLTVSIVVSYTTPYIGSGIGNVAQKQAELLASEGANVYLISSNYPKTTDSFNKNGVKYIKFPALFFLEKFHVPVPLTLLSLQSFRALSRSDVVHVHDGLYVSSFLAAMFAKLIGKKVVVTVHISHILYSNKVVDTLEKVAEYLIAKPIFEVADSILLINDELSSDFSSYSNKVHVLPNGVDTNLFHPVSLIEKKKLRIKNGITTEKKILLFVGRLVPKKGFDLLLRATSDKYQIVFVGGGEIKPEYISIPNTHWIGSVQSERLAEYYKMSDAFILPSYGEGYPLSIKEALASGLPVITTFSHKSLEPLQNKIVFKVSPNSEAIRKTITKVMDMPKNPETEKLRSEFLTKFSWSKNIIELQLVYKSRNY